MAITYVELLRVRKLLAQGRTTLADYASYAGSIISPIDVMLLRRLIRESPSSDEASSVALVLFTRGGIGNLTCEIRPWLERPEGDESNHLDSGPLLLAQTVRHLQDGMALRCLLEFADREDTRHDLEQLLGELPEPYVTSLLRRSREQQVDALLETGGDTPSHRFLWMLRTYATNARVRSYLYRFAQNGNISAFISLAVYGDILDWELFDALVPIEQSDSRLLINAALDNIARGADPSVLNRLLFVQMLDSDNLAEIDQGLEALRRHGKSLT